MKRTELLSKMLKCFQVCKEELKYSDEQAMDRALEIAEENGMLPPTYFGFGTYPINKWETEDEQN